MCGGGRAPRGAGLRRRRTGRRHDPVGDGRGQPGAGAGAVDASSAEYISSIRIDFGDGYVTTNLQTQQPTPEPATMRGSAARAHVYPTAGRYRITVTVTVVPGFWAFVPTPLPGQWMPTGAEHTVTVAADLLQRPDAAPPGFPRLPTLVSE